MAGKYIDRCTLRYKSVDLDDVITRISENDDRPTKVVHTMNKRREGRGYKQGNNTYSLDLEAEQIDDPIVPNWHALKKSGERFTLVKRPNVGKAVTYSDCVVTSVKDSTSDGDSSQSVSVMALSRS